MPFADDVRRYTFPSLDRLINKKGEVVTNHPYLPTEDQMAAMESFVDAMDLMKAGDEDDEGFACMLYSRPTCFDIVYVLQEPTSVVRHPILVQPCDPPHEAGPIPCSCRNGSEETAVATTSP